MSYEMHTVANAPRRARYGTSNTGYGELGSIELGATTSAPWAAGLPKAGDSKDNTRIAYAIRDHDLAMPPRNDATAYANLRAQAAGSATKVGKAWYSAALADVNAARAATAPRTAPAPTIAQKVPFVPQVLVSPIVKQATDMGLKIQQTADGSVVAVNGAGAVVSKPLPVPTSAVTDTNVLPANTVQANAPPVTHAPSSGIFSIFEKLTDSLTSAASGGGSSGGGSSFVASQGPPMPNVPDSAVPPIPGTQPPTEQNLFSNPIVLLGGAVVLYLLFGSHGGRR